MALLRASAQPSLAARSTTSRRVLTPSAAIRTVNSRRASVQVKALLGQEPEGGQKKKFITREEEPDQYWLPKSEREGANPFKDPIAIVGILAIFFPFIFLLVAVAVGAIDLSVYK